MLSHSNAARSSGRAVCLLWMSLMMMRDNGPVIRSIIRLHPRKIVTGIVAWAPYQPLELSTPFTHFGAPCWSVLSSKIWGHVVFSSHLISDLWTLISEFVSCNYNLSSVLIGLFWNSLVSVTPMYHSVNSQQEDGPLQSSCTWHRAVVPTKSPGGS